MKVFFSGIILGIVNILPGVSGGTMAVVLNLYDRILLALSRENWKQNLRFLLTLAGGMAVGILLFSRGALMVFERWPEASACGFIGLILGSVPLIYRKARFDGVKRRNWIPFGCALGFMIALSIIRLMPGAETGLFAPETLSFPFLALWLVISGFVSTLAMILPGISGSFILLLMGCYSLALQGVAGMDFLILLPLGTGIFCGGMAGIGLMKRLLRFHPQALYFAILGLMAGSVLMIFPGSVPSGQRMPALAALLAGGIVSAGSGLSKSRKSK